MDSIEVVDVDSGESVPTPELLATGAVLVFLRHFA